MVNRTNFHSSSQLYFTVHIFCDAKISKFMESFDETPIVGMTGEACTMLAHVIVGIAMDTVELSAKLHSCHSTSNSTSFDGRKVETF